MKFASFTQSNDRRHWQIPYFAEGLDVSPRRSANPDSDQCSRRMKLKNSKNSLARFAKAQPTAVSSPWIFFGTQAR
eukprot:scaffold48_cov311-Pinguiococcus_pyrenoidosus.AAC.311